MPITLNPSNPNFTHDFAADIIRLSPGLSVTIMNFNVFAEFYEMLHRIFLFITSLLPLDLRCPDSPTSQRESTPKTSLGERLRNARWKKKRNNPVSMHTPHDHPQRSFGTLETHGQQGSDDLGPMSPSHPPSTVPEHQGQQPQSLAPASGTVPETPWTAHRWLMGPVLGHGDPIIQRQQHDWWHAAIQIHVDNEIYRENDLFGRYLRAREEEQQRREAGSTDSGTLVNTSTLDSPFQQPTPSSTKSDPWVGPADRVIYSDNVPRQEELDADELDDGCPLSYGTDTIADTDSIPYQGNGISADRGSIEGDSQHIDSTGDLKRFLDGPVAALFLQPRFYRNFRRYS
ncbi:uncharacterized protein BT62DRAFT_1006851 [Guyanagaster necrorhizus]|uniref:Uncharacterized protein n=1 Tax=Guyanagaster necrorhizus TaxID=856835 RepID=A0A9P8ATF0_9AGAR|nr:uncharacterized protein BT62DRAFT_1006851 [Guyanagaster necrorhizus MCA 3950]KAG7445822.1 hypothetical protein BT62DRAFT_1006851 [Guyanagaster necrorhizus MCA 3950]